jgi:hypothetical protein
MHYKEYNEFAITIDIDWAPDVAIDAVADILVENKVKCTWFVTHDSPAISRLKQHTELFECGIHPNFLGNSTHGKNYREVLNYIKNIVPNARSCRMHALMQSSEILAVLTEEYGIQADTTTLLRETPGITPHCLYFREGGRPLVKLPFFWEDDTETINPEKSWDINHPKYHVKGLKIMNLHPMYLYLNTDTLHMYDQLKKIKPLYELTAEDMQPYINSGKGPMTFFKDLSAHISKSGQTSKTISELAAEWLEYQASSNGLEK